MADRYWVGGAGDWSNTARWSTTSGGASGASVPTSADNVFINASSGGGTVTMSTNGQECNNLDLTGFSGTFSVTANLTVRGNVTFSTGMTMSLASSAEIKCWPVGAKTVSLDFKTKTLGGWLTLIAEGGATISLASNVTCSNFDVSPRTGTMLTNSRTITATTSVSISQILYSSNAIDFSGSTITTPVLYFNPSGGGAYDYFIGPNHINITGNTGTSYIGSATLSGAIQLNSITFTATNHNIEIYAPTTQKITSLTINPTTKNGTYNLNTNLECSSLTINGRVTVKSNTTGVARTLTASTSFSLTNVTWKDITAAGVTPFTGTGFIDNGGNTNITFPTTQTGNGLFFGSNF